MKTLFKVIAFFILIASPVLSAKNNFDKFNESTSKRDLDKAKKLLDNWGTEKENDPQYYICYFNYYVHKSAASGMMIQKNSPNPNEESLELKEEKTGKTAGYMANKTIYDPETADKGIDYIKKGIDKFPDHYEMRFGLLWVLKELLRFDAYNSEFKVALEYFSKHRDNKFYWNDNEEIKNPEEFILGIIQDAFNKFYEKEEIWQNKKFLHDFTDLMIEYFPKNVLGYSNKGVVYFSVEDYNNALKYYLEAFKYDEKDSLVASNIAFSYLKLNKPELAKGYFKKIIEINNDPYFVNLAKEQLDILK